MGHIGNTVQTAFTSFDKQTITGTGGSTYTLTHSVANEREIEVFVNNVRQEPSVAYTVSGNTLTMTGNVASTDDFYVVYQGKAVQTVSHPSDQPMQATTGTFSSNVDVGGSLLVDTIKEGTGTNTALSIASNGLVTHPQRPIFSVRGVASSASLISTFDYVTGWTTTDVDVGNLLNAGGYAQVPTGFGGIYQITWVTNQVTGNDFNSALMYHYDGSTYDRLVRHFAFNDYTSYSTGTTIFYPLDEGDIIYVGYDDTYGVPTTADDRSNFSMMFVG